MPFAEAEIRLKNAEQTKERISQMRQEAELALQTHRQQLTEIENQRKHVLDQRAEQREKLARIKAQLEVLEHVFCMPQLQHGQVMAMEK